MFKVELRVHLRRLRTLVVLAVAAAVPAIAGVATSGDAGHRNGAQGGIYGASTFSALNHTAASLAFTEPLLLPLLVALLAAGVGSADREWGTLRYLYVQPVTRKRLLSAKFAAVFVLTTLVVASTTFASLITGLVLFGWHPLHVIGSASVPTGTATLRVAAAAGYATLCMFSIAAIAFTLGVLLPRGLEALGASVAFLIVASILDGASRLRNLSEALPVHYWQRWTGLFTVGPSADLTWGVVAQLAAAALMAAVAILVLLRRDPAA